MGSPQRTFSICTRSPPSGDEDISTRVSPGTVAEREITSKNLGGHLSNFNSGVHPTIGRKPPKCGHTLGMRIGFIGLGNMGSAMAANLVKAGHDVTVYNRSRAKADALAAEGARPADSVADA